MIRLQTPHFVVTTASVSLNRPFPAIDTQAAFVMIITDIFLCFVVLWGEIPVVCVVTEKGVYGHFMWNKQMFYGF